MTQDDSRQDGTQNTSTQNTPAPNAVTPNAVKQGAEGRDLARPQLFFVTAALVLVLDLSTKLVASRALLPRHTPHRVIGDFLRFTLTYNPGAAFGMHVGAASRWVFLVLALVIIGALWRLYRETDASALWRIVALALVIGGALGNMLDRLRSNEGVADFIDVGIGEHRFWIFNIADAAVSVGAVILVLVLWREERGKATSPSHES